MALLFLSVSYFETVCVLVMVVHFLFESKIILLYHYVVILV